MSSARRPARAIEVFFSYSHKDEKMRDELEKHLSLLKREHVITGWHDRKITAGEEWKGRIDEQLNEAHIILLLVSADFLASDYCYDIEVKRALERHNIGEARVIPIILRDVDWASAPFGKLQALPTDAKPVSSWRSRDKAFKNISEGIRRAIGELTTKIPSDSDSPAKAITGAPIKTSASLRSWNALLHLEHSIRKALKESAAEYSLGELPVYLKDEISFLDNNIAELEKELASIPSSNRIGSSLYPCQNFIGRGEAIHRLLDALPSQSPEHLILIKGPSGVGKSALARVVAQQALAENLVEDIIVIDFATETELASRLDPLDRLVDRINGQLDAEMRKILDTPTITKLSAIQKVFSQRRYLILIDNLEGSTHLRTRVLDFLRDAMTYGGKALITSTHHLTNVDYLFNLEGMKYPEAALLMRREASLKDLNEIVYADVGQLKRAWSWASGLPLAMELLVGYASEVAVSFERLLTRLEQEKVGHEEDALLKKIFNKSFKLFKNDPKIRNVIVALSTFATHGTLESLSHVSGVHGEALENALNYLHQLSLVRRVNDRYSLLPITRRFVRSAGSRRGLTKFYERAVEYYRSIIGPLDELRSQSEEVWSQLNSERQNIMAILDWCITHDEWESFIEMGLIMNSHLGYVGFYPDRLRYAYELLKAAEQLDKPDLQAWILVHEVGWINQHIPDYAEAEAATKRGLSIATELNDTKTIALAKRNLGMLLYRRAKRENDPETRHKQFDDGKMLCEEAIALYEAVGELRWKAIALRLRAMIDKEIGKYDRARATFEEALGLHRKVHDFESEALTISDLGDLAISEEDFGRARELIKQALALDEKYNRPFGRARNRQRLAHIEAKSGNKDTATILMREAHRIFEEMGAQKAIEVLKKEAKQLGLALDVVIDRQ